MEAYMDAEFQREVCRLREEIHDELRFLTTLGPLAARAQETSLPMLWSLGQDLMNKSLVITYFNVVCHWPAPLACPSSVALVLVRLEAMN